MTALLRPIAVVAVLATLVAAGTSRAQDESGAATTQAEPKFKSEKAKEAFEKGKEAFQSGDYKQAAREFKTAARGAESKEDKSLVESWETACKGMPTLEGIRKLVERKSYGRAYDTLLQQLPRYQGTPAQPLFMETYAQLEQQLFVPIETFDVLNTRAYSKKYGKTYITDASLVVKGNCLHWQSVAGQAAMLKVPAPLRDWSQFQSLEFWVNVRVGAQPQLVLMSTNVKKDDGTGRPPPGLKPGQQVVHMLAKNVTLKPTKGRWTYIRVNLSEFQAQGGAGLESVTDLRFQLPNGKTFDFFIDEIRLRRKDSEDDGGSSRRR